MAKSQLFSKCQVFTWTGLISSKEKKEKKENLQATLIQSERIIEWKQDVA